MAAPNTLEISKPEINLPPLPSERGPEYFSERDRVLAVFFQSWMEKPELVNGEIFDVFTAHNPRSGESPGLVHIKTAKTPDIRTGRIIGIDMASVGLITETALPHLHDEDFRALWLADGFEAWTGEADMLEKLLSKRIAKGAIGWDTFRNTREAQHPSRALEHAKLIPGSFSGKVAHILPKDLSADNN